MINVSLFVATLIRSASALQSSVTPAVGDDRVHRHTGVELVARTAAADDLPQLVAEHSTADRVQEEVDGEAGDVQRSAVVANDVQRLERHRDESRQLDLVHDEVQQDRDVGENVAGRDENQDDGQLHVSVFGVHLASRRFRRLAVSSGSCGSSGGVGAARRAGHPLTLGQSSTDAWSVIH